MNTSFYHFMMTYRDNTKHTPESKLAEWMFRDQGFPKQAEDYHEISDYLEMNSPFEEALAAFDELFDIYLLKQERYF